MKKERALAKLEEEWQALLQTWEEEAMKALPLIL